MTQRVDKASLSLDQPRRTPSHPTKSHIVKTKVDGKEKIIRFGEQGASTAGKPKAGESDRMKQKRASFKSRHAKNIAKGKSSPAYWANKVKWAEGGEVKMASGGSVALALIEQMRRSAAQSPEFDPTLVAMRDQRARPARRPAPPQASPQAAQPREAPLPLPPVPPAMRPDENPPPEAPRNPMRFDEGNPHVATAIRMAENYGLPREIFLSLVQQESRFNPAARSPRGAIGLGQLMPATARELGVNPLDPEQNLEGSARYLRQMLDRFGDMSLALAAYNTGPGRVARAGNTIPNIRETRNYVPSILRRAGVSVPEGFAEGGLADLEQKYAEGGEVMSDEEYDRRLLSRMKRDTGRVTEPTPAEQREAFGQAAREAGQMAADVLLPQSPLDVALMVALGPGGRAARLAGSAALASLEPSEAEASRLQKLTQLLRREAPAQANTVRDALRGAARQDREHSVIGAVSKDVAQPSQIVSGVQDRVVPSALDRNLALRSGDDVLDFHTHPSSDVGYSRFGVAPSLTDVQYYLNNYPDMRGNELRTLIVSPPNRSDPTSYNFFATDRPDRVFNPRVFNDAGYELQFATGRGRFDSIQDDPDLRDYFDYGGDLYDLVKEASPLAVLTRRAQQGVGRQERELSRLPVSPDMLTQEDLYRRLEPVMLEILEEKKFQNGGRVTINGGQVNAGPAQYNADAVDALVKQIEAEYV